MLKFRDFKDKGYQIYRCDKASIMEKDWATWLIQKRIYDDTGEKYFINVYVSDMRLWDFWGKMKKGCTSKNYRSLTIKMQLYKGDLTYNISVSHNKEFSSVEDIELLCEEIWQNLDMDYSENY
jgi:hypothetical protein